MYSLGRSGLGSVRGFQYDLGVAEMKTRSDERHPDTIGWSQELFDRAVSHAVNTAVNGISQGAQTAMLLGGASEEVFASVVQSIESYRLP